MTTLEYLLIYAMLSGSTIIIGGIASYYFGAFVKSGLIKAEILHSITAFGGGILMAAVALVLIPYGMETLQIIPVIVSFLGGAFSFYLLDRYLDKQKGSLPQLLGMLADFIPEAIAMGAVFTQDPDLGILLAVVIGLQNVPEAFNAYIDLKEMYSTVLCLAILFVLSFSGVASALVGFYFLADKPLATGVLMLFASGGIVYLIFQDIAPLSKMKKNYIPALGASLGFLSGMIGVKIMG
ncbi:ZIP family zinc transporter [Leeuwenhoekiella aestuarii]|uniref:ZIP family zinc transporter n=1 Tax=Leeuwenhoekiella aestuarii TaxID=2249426 RepID=A0A4Q0NUR6_9FLAO|nr:divalent cation transporter [Leeuwenhoekiella aestuarii]RXG11667.1 ZIP family zinc transporter [Leeuwenhoekiella aestuarii]RXG15122.1 ZIP family zinc transporter [Leeuwenhoekiella aestuarii]